jgi:hypothetical protein
VRQRVGGADGAGGEGDAPTEGGGRREAQVVGVHVQQREGRVERDGGRHEERRLAPLPLADDQGLRRRGAGDA